ncbi:MAG: chemotaxis protein CheC [Trichloromonas sp.]|jgi:chemotaxis protein CheC|nr:chemotaxis protein CheC [Trichloromonas sp.]
MNLSTLSPAQLDTLKEVSNIGMGHAATALSRMLNTRIDLRVPRIAMIAIGDIPERVGGAEAEVAGIRLAMNGPARGTLLLVFPGDSARALLARLLGRPVADPLDEMAVSALKEVGNILGSAYLVALGGMLGMPLLPSVPRLAWDMAGAVLDRILGELGEMGERALLVETEFHGEVSLPEVIRGHFLILPDPAALEAILSGAAGGRMA